MKDLAIKVPFTVFIITMLVVPVPPSSIIAIAMISNPKLNKYMDPYSLKALFVTWAGIKFVARKVTVANQPTAWIS